jgi:hypothetical protein
VALTIAGRASAVAQAEGSVILNGDFENGSANEWQAEGGIIDADGATAHGGSYSLRVAPTGGQTILTQSLRTSMIVGRELTFSGWLQSDSNRGVDVVILFWLPSGAYDTSCAFHASASPDWAQFGGSCHAPSTIYWTQLRVTTNGGSGSAYLDDLSLTAAGDGPGFRIEKRPATFGEMPSDATIVGLSSRHNEAGDDDTRDEVYVMSDSGVATRITYTAWAHTHCDVSPDRTMVVAGRFWGDLDKNGKYEEVKDPQALWLLDLKNGQEWQLVPDWYWSGMGGVVFSPDGQWVYFGAIDGPYGRLYRVRPDGSDLTRISEDTAWQSDIGISRDGNWLLYHRQERVADGSFVNKGEIWAMRPDGSENHRVTDGGAGDPDVQGGWPIGDFDAEFSPDGRQVIFAHNDPAHSGWGIARVNADGSGRTDLVVGSATHINGIPDWGLDDRILFSVWDWTSGNLRTSAAMNEDGSGLRLLEGASIGDDGLSWTRWIRPLQEATPVGGSTVDVERQALQEDGSRLSREQVAALITLLGLLAVLLLAPGIWYLTHDREGRKQE